MLKPQALLGLLVLACPAAAFDQFVDGSANCSLGTGSAATPFCTLAEAIAVAPAGGVIRLAPGTYVEPFLVVDDLTIIGTHGADVTVISGGDMETVATVSSGAHLRLENLTIAEGAEPIGFTLTGGIYSRGSLTMVDSIVRDCVVSNEYSIMLTGEGGGELILQRCEFHDNGDGDVVAAGDASVFGTPVTIEDCTFHNNDISNGNCLNLFQAEACVDRSSFVNNSGLGNLAAVSFVQSDVQMTNCTVSANEALGILISGELGFTESYLRNLTVTGNRVRPFNFAAGLMILGFGSVGLPPEVEVTASIIAGNAFLAASSNLADIYIAGAVSGGHNLIGADDQMFFVDGVMGNIVGSAANPVDSGLAPLGDNGGPTPTHSLLPGSPAVGTGPTSGFAPFDQRGAPRTPSASDMGAVRQSWGQYSGVCAGAPNSTGAVGQLFCFGSTLVSDNQVELQMAALPPNALTLGLVSLQSGVTQFPGGSEGVLCLSGPIGRMLSSGQVAMTDSLGLVSLSVDLAAIPRPVGTMTTVRGTIWHFQGWHRDTSAAGPTSNFTRSTCVLFN